MTTGRSLSRTWQCRSVTDTGASPAASWGQPGPRQQPRSCQGHAAPSLFPPRAHQDEVGLVGGEHQHRDVVLGQRRDDRPGNLGDAGGLAAGGRPAVGDDAEHQPRRVRHLHELGGRQLCEGKGKLRHGAGAGLSQQRGRIGVPNPAGGAVAVTRPAPGAVSGDSGSPVPSPSLCRLAATREGAWAEEGAGTQRDRLRDTGGDLAGAAMGPHSAWGQQ